MAIAALVMSAPQTTLCGRRNPAAVSIVFFDGYVKERRYKCKGKLQIRDICGCISFVTGVWFSGNDNNFAYVNGAGEIRHALTLHEPGQ